MCHTSVFIWGGNSGMLHWIPTNFGTLHTLIKTRFLNGQFILLRDEAKLFGSSPAAQNIITDNGLLLIVIKDAHQWLCWFVNSAKPMITVTISWKTIVFFNPYFRSLIFFFFNCKKMVTPSLFCGLAKSKCIFITCAELRRYSIYNILKKKKCT